jgi:hypothetical protein
MPVDVLEAAQRVAWRRDPQQAAQPLRPGPGEVGDVQRALDHGALQPEAQDDMGRVGQLVGVHADEAALDPAPEPGQVGGRVGLGVAAVAGLELAAEKGKEAVRPAGLHLDDEGLRFMRGHPGGLAHGLAGESLGQATLIQGMAGFVQHAEQRLGRIGLAVEGGEADVSGRAAAEGMQAFVEA